MGDGSWVSVTTFRREAAVTLGAGALEATFLPRLGMLGVSLRDRGQELLDLTGGLAKIRAQRTTGLPLLAPWANRLGGRHYEVAGVHVDLSGLPLHVDGNSLPIHGTMLDQSGWQVRRLEAEPGAAVLAAEFAFGAHPAQLASFPFPHDLGFEATVSVRGLTVSTTIRPTGDRPVPVAFGYHPYFHMPGAARRWWRLTLPAREEVVLDDRGLPSGDTKALDAETVALGELSFDHLYALGDERRLSVAGGGCRVVVDYEEGYPYAQVFSPAGAPFVAIEPMTAPTDALRHGTCPLVHPGETFTARFTIRPAAETPRTG